MQRAVGANHLLDDLSMEDLLEFLHNEFSDFTTNEIKHAINETIIERLQVFDINGKRLGATTYDQFGAHYLTPILKSYQHFRGAIIKKYYDGIEAEKEAERIKAIPPRTKEDERQERLTFALTTFKNFKNDLPCIGLDRVYNFLKAEGKINYDKDRRAQFKAQAKENIMADARRGDANSRAKSIAEILKTNETYNGVLEIAGKALAVKAYFTELIGLNAELSDYFEKEETKAENQQVK